MYNPLAILNQLHLLHDEYTNREQGRKGNRLVIIFDEFEETLGKIEEHLFNQELEAKEIKREITFIRYLVKSLASGGRKFGINLILINHSFNCSALKIDSNHRNNFVGIFLNEAADNYVRRGGYDNRKVKTWILKERVEKYRAVITGAMKDSPILHPTHHDYAQVEDGQKSKTLVELRPFKLTINTVKYGVIKPTKKVSEELSSSSSPQVDNNPQSQPSKDLEDLLSQISNRLSHNYPQEIEDKAQNKSEKDLEELSDELSSNSPPDEDETFKSQSDKDLGQFSGEKADKLSGNSPQEIEDNSQTKSDKDLEEFSGEKADKLSGNSPQEIEDNSQTNSDKDLEELSGEKANKLSPNFPQEIEDNSQNQSDKGLGQFSAQLSPQQPDTYPPLKGDNSQTQLNQELSAISNLLHKHFCNRYIVNSSTYYFLLLTYYLNSSFQDLVRLEKIYELWAKGEKRITIIVPQVWADIRGDKPPKKWVSSRAYRKCREEYRKLTGK